MENELGIAFDGEYYYLMIENWINEVTFYGFYTTAEDADEDLYTLFM